MASVVLQEPGLLLAMAHLCMKLVANMVRARAWLCRKVVWDETKLPVCDGETASD